MTLALIAGRGDLPARVAGAQDRMPLVCALEGTPPQDLTPDVTFRLETLGTLMADLSARGVKQVCFCGAIDRPAFDPSRLDAATAPFVPLFQKALAAGDNGALSILKEIFEEQGFEVLGADSLMDDLVATPGVLSARAPDAQMRRDAARGETVLAGLAPLDLGQACVIAQEQVLGIETMGGTDHLLSSLPDVAERARGILCKGPKTGQIREIDLPTIGPATLEAAYRAGLAGVVIDAGGVIILDQARCVELADLYGMVLWSRPVGIAE